MAIVELNSGGTSQGPSAYEGQKLLANLLERTHEVKVDVNSA